MREVSLDTPHRVQITPPLLSNKDKEPMVTNVFPWPMAANLAEPVVPYAVPNKGCATVPEEKTHDATITRVVKFFIVQCLIKSLDIVRVPAVTRTP